MTPPLRSRFARCAARLAALVGMLAAAPALGQYVYPPFTYNVNIQWGGFRVDQNVIVIPPNQYTRYVITIDYLTNPNQNGNPCGIEYAFVDRASPFPPFFIGNVFTRRVWDGLTCVPPPPDFQTVIRVRGRFSPAFVAPGQLWWYVRQFGGIGATYRRVALHLLPDAPPNDLPGNAAPLPASGVVADIQPAAADPVSSGPAPEPALCVPTPYTLWYTVSPQQSGPHFVALRQTGFARPTGAALAVFAARIDPITGAATPGDRLACTAEGLNCGAALVAELVAGETFFIAAAETLGPDLTELPRYSLSVSTLPPPSPGCNPADIVGIGNQPCPDESVTPDDFVAFVNAFAANAAVADITDIGAAGLPDGQITGDDFVLFINSFVAGCG
ncbi:MAG: hypothetical protein IOD15_08730 [Phycisphaerales bacterium]|jgi:hypothetical protein|nr:hypothetical protein [Phycisphaerales bacterium]